MEDIKVWVLTGVVVAGTSVIGYLLHLWVSNILTVLKEIKVEVAKQNTNQAVQKNDIDYLKEAKNKSELRLDNHEIRIIDLEKNKQ